MPSDQRLADLVRDIPGFGGMYYDSAGALTILMKDPGRAAAAKPHLAAFLKRGKRQSPQLDERVSRDMAGMKVRKARHDFRDLNSWHRLHVSEKAHRVSGTVLTAIDPRNNRIVVGVASVEHIAPMRSLVAQLPVPAGVVEVIEIGDIRPTNKKVPMAPFADTSLTDGRFSPVPGGGQVAYTRNNQTEACTIGFNAKRWLDQSTVDSDRFFITASHCTLSQGAFDSGFNMFHPLLNDAGSVEVIDPPFFTTGSTSPANQCPSGRICFFVDAVLMKWTSSSTAQHGYVAATNRNSTAVNGGRYSVDYVDDAYQGQVVHHTGTIIGRDYGQVVYPCANVSYTQNLKTLICQGVAEYVSLVGDSGGPVYAMHSGNSLTAVGIHYAHNNAQNPTLGFFSPMSSVLNAIYDASSGSYFMDIINGGSSQPSMPPVYNPPSAYASISGTSTAGFNMSCQFFSGTDIGDPLYEWTVDGDVVGTGASVYYQSGTSSYTLVLHVWSPTTGQHAWDDHDVTVDENTSQCWAQ